MQHRPLLLKLCAICAGHRVWVGTHDASNLQTQRHVSGFSHVRPSEQHWDHSRFRGHLVLAAAAVSSHAPHTLLLSVWEYLPLCITFCHSLTLSLSLSLTHTHNQQAVSILGAGEVRWREWVSQWGRGMRGEQQQQRRRRGKRAGRNRRMVQSRYLNCVCVCVYLCVFYFCFWTCVQG